MISRLCIKNCMIVVAMTIGLLTVVVTHSGALELQMAAMGDCSAKMQCCDCTVPEVAPVFAPEYHPILISVPHESPAIYSLIEEHNLYHPPK